MVKKLFVFFVIFLAFSASNLFSQDVLKVKANLLILDGQNKYINEVAREDIKIFEDGVEQKVTYFAKKEPILNLGIVVDNSGSMRFLFDELIFMSLTVAENLRPDDNAFVIRFIDSSKIEIIQEWSSDKTKLNMAIENMYSEGGQTAIIDALYLASNKLLERAKKDDSQMSALVLISDGVDRSSYYKLDQLFDLYKNSDAQIFTFSFPEEEAKSQIKKFNRIGKQDYKALLLNNIVANETGGTAFTLSKKYNKAEIIENLKSLVKELRSNYIIGYDSTNPKRKGETRKLTVEIAAGKDDQKRIGSVRESFVAVDKNKIKY